MTVHKVNLSPQPEEKARGYKSKLSSYSKQAPLSHRGGVVRGTNLSQHSISDRYGKDRPHYSYYSMEKIGPKKKHGYGKLISKINQEM